VSFSTEAKSGWELAEDHQDGECKWGFFTSNDANLGVSALSTFIHGLRLRETREDRKN
jgi:hypothetical protein